MNIWEITNDLNCPRMYCAHEPNDLSDDAVNRLIKQLLKRCKKESISVQNITVSVDDDGTTVCLVGNDGGLYW